MKYKVSYPLFTGNLVGVAELCNKIGKPAFTVHDEQIATTFAVYCAISISHVGVLKLLLISTFVL